MWIDPQVREHRDILAHLSASVYAYACETPDEDESLESAAYRAITIAEALLKEAEKRAVAAAQQQRGKSFMLPPTGIVQ